MTLAHLSYQRPKCGSSTLQTALLESVDGAGGQKIDMFQPWYKAAARARTCHHMTPVYGDTRADTIGRNSAYVSYTSFRISPMRVYAEKMYGWRLAHSKAGGKNYIQSCRMKAGFTGMLSSQILKSAVIQNRWMWSFLRPPIEWLNASYWQWGFGRLPIWAAWIQRSGMPYSFGMDLKAR
jgi:hypothetical protein